MLRTLLSSMLLASSLFAVAPVRAADPAPLIGAVRAAERTAAPLVTVTSEPPLHRGPLTPDTPLRTRSGLTVWGLEHWFARRHPALRGTASAFLEAERRYRVNARALIAIAGGESGWGTSWIARNKRNLFGFGALHRDPARYAVRFSTLEEGILHVAHFISRHYLRPGGKYHHGATLNGMMRKWAPAGSWARMISRVSRGITPPDPIRNLVWGAPALALLPAGPPALDPDAGIGVGGGELELSAPVARRRAGLPDPAVIQVCLLLTTLDGEGEQRCAAGTRDGDLVRWRLPLPDPESGARTFSLRLADQDGSTLLAQPWSAEIALFGRIDPIDRFDDEGPATARLLRPVSLNGWRLTSVSTTQDPPAPDLDPVRIEGWETARLLLRAGQRRFFIE